MSAHFHKLKVKSVNHETPECVSISFDVPESLKQEFIYKEGQNVSIRKIIDGEDVRRTYSICSAPYENNLKIAVKKIAGGIFSSFANETLKAGDELELMQPIGKFTAKLKDGNTGSYLAIAAGSGITPVIAIIKHTLSTQPDSRFTLIYGNRTRSSIIFFEELEGLKNKYINRFNFINILSRERTDAEVNFGRIDEAKLSSLSRLVNYPNMDGAYICGPTDMIFEAKNFLQKQGIEEGKIHYELFTVPGQATVRNVNKTGKDNKDTGPKSSITIKLDGRSINFELGQNSESILDGALKQGADLPFACKGGVCATCKAKVLEGKVKMDTNYALEQDEVDAGFILTCQSHPLSDNVVIDFDIK